MAITVTLPWPCNICGEKRFASSLSVATGKLKDFPGCEINISYCNDKQSCQDAALESAAKGEFPKKVS